MTASARHFAPFSFDTVFDADGHVVRSSAGRNEYLTPQEVSVLEAKAYERGRADAAARAAQDAAEAMGTLARLSQLILTRLSAEAASLRIDAVEVGLAVGKAVAAEALARYGDDAVLSAVAEAIGQLRDAPRLVVRLAPALEASMAPQLERMIRDAGFPGALIVRADPAVAAGDVSLEWGEGAIHRNRDTALAAIDEAAARWLASADQAGDQLDLFSAGSGE